MMSVKTVFFVDACTLVHDVFESAVCAVNFYSVQHMLGSVACVFLSVVYLPITKVALISMFSDVFVC